MMLVAAKEVIRLQAQFICYTHNCSEKKSLDKIINYFTAALQTLTYKFIYFRCFHVNIFSANFKALFHFILLYSQLLTNFPLYGEKVTFHVAQQWNVIILIHWRTLQRFGFLSAHPFSLKEKTQENKVSVSTVQVLLHACHKPSAT